MPVLCCVALDAYGQSPEAEIVRGDSCWDALNSWQAFQFYTSAENHHGDEHAITWRMARVYTAFALTSVSQPDEVWNYERAKEWADRSLSLDSNSEQAHVARAVYYGWRTYMEQDNDAKLKASRIMYDEVTRALALNKGDDFAWNILGQWNREVAKLSWIKKLAVNLIYGGLPPASFDASVYALNRALDMRPLRIMHYLELGKTFLAMGRTQDGRNALQHAIDLPSFDGVDGKEKVEATRLLKENAE